MKHLIVLLVFHWIFYIPAFTEEIKKDNEKEPHEELKADIYFPKKVCREEAKGEVIVCRETFDYWVNKLCPILKTDYEKFKKQLE